MQTTLRAAASQYSIGGAHSWKTSKPPQKKIGLIGCIATGIGCIIGSGIFGSLPTVINDIGPGVILALVGAVIYTLAKMNTNV